MADPPWVRSPLLGSKALPGARSALRALVMASPLTGNTGNHRWRPRRRDLVAELERRRATEAAATRREMFLAAVLESMDTTVVAVDTDGNPVVWNAAAGAGNQLAAALEAQPIRRALDGERIRGEEIETHVAGVTRRLSINAGPVTLPDGRTAGAVCTGTDISQLALRESELARANRDLEAIASVTAQVLNGDDARQAVVDASLAVSDAVTAMLFEPTGPAGTTLAAVAQAGVSLAGHTVATDGLSRTAEAFRTGRVQLVADIQADAKVDQVSTAAVAAAASSGRPLQAMIAMPVMRDGVPRAVLSVAFDYAVSTSDLRLLGLLELLATDAALAITREDAARELTRLAGTDPLTGLANRRRWDEKLDEEVERARRTGLPLCVVILDLDHFKRFNDSRGHQAGDDLLAAGAKSWARVLRSGDLLARLGGEEFGVLLPGCSASAAPGLVERLINALPEDQTCSAGVAEWGGEPAGHTIARADEALYEAKRAGRATFRIASGEASSGLPQPRPASAA